MIIAIAAHDDEWGIGKNNGIPWRCKEDFKHFKETTKGHKVVMGRKTWESLPKKPLPDRINIVLTRQKDYKADGAIISDDIVWPDDGETIYVMGGLEVYREYAPYLDELLLTRIPGKYDCDTFWDIPGNWVSVEEGIEIADGVVVYKYIRNPIWSH